MLPVVRTDRLLLVPFCRDDVDVLHAIWTDADVRRYLWDDLVIPRSRAAETVDAAIAAAQVTGVGMWTIRGIEAPDVVVGFCGLRYFDATAHRTSGGDSDVADGCTVELLYGLLPQYWRRGRATEASKAVLRYAFCELGLPRVFADADRGNVESFGVMVRLGMTPVHAGVAAVPGALYYQIESAAYVACEERA
jgi:ribosomal-protein-alanine N-acetyltransferase